MMSDLSFGCESVVGSVEMSKHGVTADGVSPDRTEVWIDESSVCDVVVSVGVAYVSRVYKVVTAVCDECEIGDWVSSNPGYIPGYVTEVVGGPSESSYGESAVTGTASVVCSLVWSGSVLVVDGDCTI